MSLNTQGFLPLQSVAEADSRSQVARAHVAVGTLLLGGQHRVREGLAKGRKQCITQRQSHIPLAKVISQAAHKPHITCLALVGAQATKFQTTLVVGCCGERQNRWCITALDSEVYKQAIAGNEVIVHLGIDRTHSKVAIVISFVESGDLLNRRTRTRANQLIDGATDVDKKSKLQLFEELYDQQNNQPMSQQQRDYIRDLIESIWGGRE